MTNETNGQTNDTTQESPFLSADDYCSMMYRYKKVFLRTTVANYCRKRQDEPFFQLTCCSDALDDLLLLLSSFLSSCLLLLLLLLPSVATGSSCLSCSSNGIPAAVLAIVSVSMRSTSSWLACTAAACSEVPPSFWRFSISFFRLAISLELRV